MAYPFVFLYIFYWLVYPCRYLIRSTIPTSISTGFSRKQFYPLVYLHMYIICGRIGAVVESSCYKCSYGTTCCQGLAVMNCKEDLQSRTSPLVYYLLHEWSVTIAITLLLREDWLGCISLMWCTKFTPHYSTCMPHCTTVHACIITYTYCTSSQ